MRYSIWTNGRAPSAAFCALRILDAATICIAFVICAVPLMDRMRRLRSRGLFMATVSRSSLLLPRLRELVGGRLQLRAQLRADRLLFDNLPKQVGLAGRQEVRPFSLERLD